MTEKVLQDTAFLLGCEPEVIRAVCEVEAPRGGFYKNGLPVILYEPYLFSDLTKGQFDGKTVTVADEKYPLSINRRKKPWTVANAKYGPSSIQYAKLEAAKALNEEAAYKACSWGRFQILGSNHLACGYATVKDFIVDMHTDEDAHLRAFAKFIMANKLHLALQSKNWFEFAYHYNGPRQDKGTADKSDDYATILEKAYNKIKKMV